MSSAVASLVAEIASHNEATMKGDKKRNLAECFELIEAMDLADIAKISQFFDKIKETKSPEPGNKDFGLHIHTYTYIYMHT